MNEKTGEMSYGFASNLRDALPNASFFGSTGTPIEMTDANTRVVAGDRISIYDIRRVVADHPSPRLGMTSKSCCGSITRASSPSWA